MDTSIPDERICAVYRFGQPIPYQNALDLQYGLLERRRLDLIPDTLLLLQHTPVITLGRKTAEHDLLTRRDQLESRGIDVVEIDRGGEITYHGPGQIVGYPILDLRRHGSDLHAYLRQLEEVIIVTLARFGLIGERVPGRTGVWTRDRKVAAIGIKVSRWVSMHGFAFNVDDDLTPFRKDFVPCGIRDRGVTSLRELLGPASPALTEVEETLLDSFAKLFDLRLTVQESEGIILP